MSFSKRLWHGCLSGTVVLLACAAFASARRPAQQAMEGELPRLIVLRSSHLVGPSVMLSAAEANCTISGSGDAATMKCQPTGVTQKNAYHFNTALVSDPQGSAYVIACRIGLVNNLWCKSLAEGRVLQGRLAKGRMMVSDAGSAREYLVLKSAQIGALANYQTTTAKMPAPAAQAGATTATQPRTGLNGSNSPAADAPACGAPTEACVNFVSDPQGADIYVDGKFVGNAPSMLPLTAGPHEIRMEAPQRKTWVRTLEASAGGRITLRGNLEAGSPGR